MELTNKRRVNAASKMSEEDTSSGMNNTKDKNTTILEGISSGVNNAQSGGNTASSLGAGITTAGAATGNPLLIGAGLGLKVIGGAKEKEQAREKQAISNEIQRRDRVMQALGRLGQGFGGLG